MNNTIIIILVILAMCAGLGGFYFIKRKSKNKAEEKSVPSEAQFKELNNEEAEIVNVVKNHLAVDFELFVYRDAANWKRISDYYKLKTPPKAFAIVNRNIVCVSKFDHTYDTEIFTKLVIHEALHLKGFKHSDTMFNEEVKVTNEIFHRLNFR